MQFLLDHIVAIVHGYKGHPPLVTYLKNYFKNYPRLGSRDRKALTEAAFIYFRFANCLANDSPVLDVVKYGLERINTENVFLKKIIGESNNFNVTKKENFLIYPIPVSEGLTMEKWLQSLQQQPQLFIRVRKHKDQVVAALESKGITWDFMPYFDKKMMLGVTDSDCLRIANRTNIDGLLNEEDYVVQDWASQQSMFITLSYLEKTPNMVWDVCAGAGGKSIFLKDKLPPFTLLATDIRESILHNLKMRFRLYGLKGFETKVVNSAVEPELDAALGTKKIDFVLCDVPCSGSGTWARNPEQFHFFKESDLHKFEQLQYPIARNALRYLKPGGTLAYITCSVFRKENEAVVEKLALQADIQIVYQRLIDGIDYQSDCMFVALLRKQQ